MTQHDLERLVAVLDSARAYLSHDDETEAEPDIALEHIEHALEILLPVRLDMAAAAIRAEVGKTP